MKIFAIGRNYADHAKELNNQVPDEPVIFLKPETAIVKNNKPFFIPDFSNDVHHEVEIVLKVCKVGKNISEKFARRYFDQVTVGIDFTARDLQAKLKAKGLPWELSKAFDHSAPIGKFISVNDLGHLHEQDFGLMVNGNWVQRGNTRDMIFSFEKIISFVSRYFTLQMGDLIFTGTPAGVGQVHVNDHLQAFLGEEMLLDFMVK